MSFAPLLLVQLISSRNKLGMAVVSRLRSAFRRQSTDDVATIVNMNAPAESKSDPPLDTVAPEKFGPDGQNGTPQDERDEPQGELQHGVSDMKAVTATWSMWSLIALFIK